MTKMINRRKKVIDYRNNRRWLRKKENNWQDNGSGLHFTCLRYLKDITCGGMPRGHLDLEYALYMYSIGSGVNIYIYIYIYI